jgi:ubiquinone/menaquinone biosynthesis C-methylase UbiE
MESSRPISESHDSIILDQFTRQAEPFVRRHQHHDRGLLDAMAACVGVAPDDAVLDVACGPGIVSCYFATRARHVTGVDIVPAMLERAQRLQAESRVENVTWKLGSCTDLPFENGSFDCVVTRFSFHHFIDPEIALREMVRVTRPGGNVLVCDVAPRSDVQEQFNQWEILRDPSHTRALTEAEFDSLAVSVGLEHSRKQHYGLEMDLEGLVSGSFPEPGNAERIVKLFEEEIQTGTDRLGVAACRSEKHIKITYPVLLLAGRKPLH